MSSTAQSITPALPATASAEALMKVMSDSLTDQMVERLTTTVGNALEVLDRLNDDHTREAVHSLFDELTKLHRAGGLVPLFELINMVNAIRNAMTDSMVERLAIFVESMVTNMANEDMADLVGRTHLALMEAQDEMASSKSQGGLMASLRLLSAPETQSALRFLVSVSKHLQTDEV